MICLGTFYYAFIAILSLSFLSCVIITIFDNSKEREEVLKQKKLINEDYKSRRKQYNNYLNNINSSINYYSYTRKKVVKPEVTKIEELTEKVPVIEAKIISVCATDEVSAKKQRVIPTLGTDFPGTIKMAPAIEILE